MADLAETALGEARRVALNASRSLRRAGTEASGKALALVAELESTTALLERVVAQTRLRISGETPDGSTRVVSLHDPDARPIAKGRLGKPVEFGYKAQVVDNVDGIVVDYAVFMGNPGDRGLLLPAIARVTARLGRAPRAVTADRGYSDGKVEAGLTELGVKTVVIPRNGRPGAARQATQRSPGFRRLVKWHRLDGLAGAQTWCGLGILAHNAVKIGALIDQDDEVPVSPTRPTTPTPRVRGRPPDKPTPATVANPTSPM
jgi:IS5 family transposase